MSEGKTIGIRMAKATREDLDGAHELAGILESLERGYYPARETDEDPPTFFDHEDVEHLQYLVDRLLAIARKSSLFRVAGGLETLLSDNNAVVDPVADCIELHPRIKSALANVVPGVMHCAKCKFRLVRTNLNARDGTTSAGDNVTEPCPNGCGPLWPVTWEQEARECRKLLEDMVPFQGAFFEIAAALDIGAKPYSPKEAMERDILPRIRELRASHG